MLGYTTCVYLSLLRAYGIYGGRRGFQIPWNWSYKQKWGIMQAGEPNPGPLQEEKGLLTAESSPPIKLPNL